MDDLILINSNICARIKIKLTQSLQQLVHYLSLHLQSVINSKNK